LQFLSISTAGSAVSFFAEKSASGGVVRLVGGSSSPGFSGNKLIATVSFKSISDSGGANLAFTEDSSIYRDSDNENILTGKGIASFTFGKAVATTTAPTKNQSASSIQITNVAATEITRDSALVSWKTSSPASSTVEFGTDLEYGFVQTSSDMVTDHSILLKELLVPGMTYHFRVVSKDASGGETQSADMTFKSKGYDIVIRVKDTNSKSIEGASVTLYSEIQQGTTDANGESRFSDVAAGKHGVIIKSKNQTATKEIEVQDENAMEFEIQIPANNIVPDYVPWILYGFLGFVFLLTIGILVYYVVKHKTAENQTPTTPSNPSNRIV
jgi:hypothetical protein